MKDVCACQDRRKREKLVENLWVERRGKETMELCGKDLLEFKMWSCSGQHFLWRNTTINQHTEFAFKRNGELGKWYRKLELMPANMEILDKNVKVKGHFNVNKIN